jgi:CheY-like chemotaxis protein
MLSGTQFQALPARNLREARSALTAFMPHAIVLDILLSGEDAWTFLAEIKRSPETQHVPVAVITNVDDRAKGFSLGADAYCIKPIDRHTLLQTLTRLVEPERVRRILVVDDEDISRYVLRQHLTAPRRIVTRQPTAPKRCAWCRRNNLTSFVSISACRHRWV